MRYSKSNNIYITVAVLSMIVMILFSCKKEEDKYPEMLFFEPNMKGDFVFEEIDPIPMYKGDTKEYVFFCTNYLASEKRVLIYDKKTKKLKKTIAIPDGYISIRNDDTFFVFDKKTKKAYTYIPPQYKQQDIEQHSLHYVADQRLKKQYASEIKREQLEGQELSAFIQNKRYEVLKERVIDSLLCITDIGMSNTIIAHYKNKDVHLTDEHYLYKGFIIKSKLKGIRNCESSNRKLDETDYFNTNPLTLIDQVTLDYSLTGSNHFAIGVSSNDLFYYELTLNDKSIRFKSSEPISNIVNLENQVILKASNIFYKVSLQ